MILTRYVTQNIYFDTKEFSALTLGRAVTFHNPPPGRQWTVKHRQILQISYLWIYLAVLTLFRKMKRNTIAHTFLSKLYSNY